MENNLNVKIIYRNAKLERIMKPENYTDEDMKDMKKGVTTSFIVATVVTVINIIIEVPPLFELALKLKEAGFAIDLDKIKTVKDLVNQYISWRNR